MTLDPPQLFSVRSDQYAAADRAWDCGTGSGQAAVALAQCVDCFCRIGRHES